MKDLTQGSIRGHLAEMSLFIGASMIVQTLYYLIDLYFVAGLGEQALAGVSAAGNVLFIAMALYQIVSVSTITLVSHAVGRRAESHANLVFNQSLLLSALCTVVTLIAGYALTSVYMNSVSADAGTAAMGRTYLHWFIPGMALQFSMVTMSAALRGTGITRPATIVQVATLVFNGILAPVLIAGWGTGHPLGVAGAALSSTASIALGTGLLTLYFSNSEKYLFLDFTLWRPHFQIWKSMGNIGLPAGGEFAVIFFIHCLVYWCIQPFGSAAQAGYGVGSRVMQAIFLPAMAVAFAASPIAGQNFGARQANRVRETFRSAAFVGSVIMAVLTISCQWRPELMIRGFVSDPHVVDIGARYLRIMSWNFVGIGLVFTCSGLFRAVGNTWPTLATGAARVLLFGFPAVWLSMRPDTRLEYYWYLSVATIGLQAILSLWLLRREFHKRLAFFDESIALPAHVSTPR